MRRFRLKSDEDYKPLNQGEIYDSELVPNGWGCSVGDSAKNFPNEWEEVTEPKNLKDTDLGYFTLEIMKSIIEISPYNKTSKETTNSIFVSDCIDLAEELIKQLNEKIK